MTGLVCTGCGRVVDAPLPFRCPGAGDGRDHVLARRGPPAGAVLPGEGEADPFLRYRALAYGYEVARARGLSDADVVGVIDALGDAVAAVDGRRFAITPVRAAPELGLGDVWIKDETGNVAGSHKARHLFGLAVYLEVAERAGLTGAAERARPLAIASCGNAALAAAVVARAARRPLRVFVPPTADAAVLDRLAALGAAIEPCPRGAGDPPGDPCHHRFRAAVDAGALPFSCQGSDNGLTIDGGMTLGFELATQAGELDRVIVQVGGGALASAVIQALGWAHALGAIARRPAVHAVQTEGGFPLVRAWRRVARELAIQLGGERDATPAADLDRGRAAAQTDAAAARWLAARATAEDIDGAIRAAAADRTTYMWPWETEPRSAASGILDDETYDWLAIVRGMLETGGWPVVAAEATILDAHARARAAGVAASATGSAGLAGVLALADAGLLGVADRVAVLLTGVQR